MTDFDFERFLELPRLSGLRLSPDGRRLVVAVAGPDPEGRKMRSAIWQVDPAGVEPARRLTRSAAGESGGAAFLPDGSLVFASSRPDPDVKPDPDRKVQALWLLPPDAGEARLLRRPGRRRRRHRERPRRPGRRLRRRDVPRGCRLRRRRRARHGAQGRRRRRAPVRGRLPHPPLGSLAGAPPPAPVRRHARRRPRGAAAGAARRPARRRDAHVRGDRDGPGAGRDVPRDRPTTTRPRCPTSARTSSIHDLGDGRGAPPHPRRRLVRVAGRLAGRARRRRSPDHVRQPRRGQPRQPRRWWTSRPASSGRSRRTSTAGRRARRGRRTARPSSSPPTTTATTRPSASTSPTSRVTRLTAAGALGDLCPTPDGTAVYALCSTIGSPPRIVRLDARMADQVPEELPNGIDEHGIVAPGVVERLTAQAADGTAIGSWLVRPAAASAEHPAPLVVWVHGGPLGLVERLALALEPARAGGARLRGADARPGALHRVRPGDDRARLGRLGRDSVHGRHGGGRRGPRRARRTWTRSRTALMGGSFGGYMANWVAGQTDRFRAIVTHASLWELRGFHGTTDTGACWEREMGDPYREPGALRPPVAVEHLASDPDADAGDPRRAGLPGAGQRGAPALDGPAPPRRRRRSSCTSPTRTTGS